MIKTSLNNQNQFNVCLLFILNQNLKQRKVTVKVNSHYQIPKFLILMMSLTQDQQCKILDSDEEFSSNLWKANYCSQQQFIQDVSLPDDQTMQSTITFRLKPFTCTIIIKTKPFINLSSVVW